MTPPLSARLLAARERLAAGGFKNGEEFLKAVAEERAAFEEHQRAMEAKHDEPT